ncbi:AAA family ATPase, partial [Candidatus Fermentibacteria bacterium]|nr:AAA family ATPase [Candidatus Fermentibacteria bacterium]
MMPSLALALASPAPTARVVRSAVSVAPQTTISLLGPPQVHDGGSAVRLCRRRTMALLAYLAVEPGPHRRESLVALLWPECGPSHAQAYLRNSLWEVSKSPVGRWCAIGNDTVRLRKTTGIGVDVSTFQGLLARGEEEGNEELPEPAVQAFTAAVDLYRGHFMAGFTLPDSPPFDEWQSSQDEALRQQLGVALQRLIRHHLNRGEITRAVSLGNRWVCLDPLDETVYSRLMTIYSSAGHPDLALRQFELCERTLREQLQAQPRDTTRALFQDIRLTVHERRIVLAAPPTEEPCLPCWPTPFVGRERELDEIADLLHTGECRVLTLVGYGGSGKTRLAVEALTRRKESEECRVVFVPLADMQSPLQAVTGIMDALSARLTVRSSVVRDTRNTDDLLILLQRLVLVLRGSRVMLVLDNAEHVEGMDSIARAVVEGSPDTTLLITSRHRLGLHAEWVFPVRGLGFPDERRTGDPMMTHPAVQVFLNTARRISHHFMPGEADAQAIVKACSLLEGSPLAIELAAAWIGTLSCTEIVAEIERSMDFLTSACADLPARQRSMRAVFEHSWVLLPQEAQRALVSLSVFRGGFTKEAASEIAGATVGILAALTDRSFIYQAVPGRYDVHQVVRKFAEERLDASVVESFSVRDRHARFFLREIARHAPALETRGQREAIAALDADSQNMASAWVRGAASGWTKELHAAAQGLFLYHDMTGRIIEGGGLFEQAALALASSLGDDSETLRAFLSSCYGWFLCGRHPTRGCEELERSVRLLRRGPPSRHAALGLTLLAIAYEEREPSEAERMFRESSTVFERLKDRWGTGVALEGLA